MPRELLLLRHGKSDWSVASDDFNRPLKKRGINGAQRIGAWLLQQALIPDLVVSSPAQRAIQTAELCCNTMGIETSHIVQDERLYLADLDDLLSVLAACPADKRRVMVVGHNPDLEELLCHFAKPPPKLPPDGKLMPTATVARLSMPDDWRKLKKGQATLLDLKRPSNLPKTFPFPNPNSNEEREQPAYYYTQSSVIPYRIKHGQIEILMIRSNSSRHWIIPKGIVEIGLSPVESARKEALEEAGVEGEVEQQALGHYDYHKWGGTCSVTVYAMRVDRQLSEQEWVERHRGRRWSSVKEAAKQLKQKSLTPLLALLEKRLKEQQTN